jgi:hypothetical protein
MWLPKGSTADSKVGEGLIGLWSDGRRAESHPETDFGDVGQIGTDKRATGVCQTGCKGTGGER